MELKQFSLFNQHSAIKHFTTTRIGGVSGGTYSSLNLSYKVGDRFSRVRKNRERIADSIGVGYDRLLFPDQCHTDRVKVITATQVDVDLTETDALITNQKDLGIGILAADCVPILLFDPVKRIIGAVHTGWRGTAKRIVSRTIEKMIKRFGARPVDMLAGIGPAISQEKYEAGAEVVAPFKTLFSDHPNIIIEKKTHQKAHIDLQEANRVLLLRAGLKNEHIEVMNICTYSNPELFFSARRDGFHSGRFGVGIILLD